MLLASTHAARWAPPAILQLKLAIMLSCSLEAQCFSASELATLAISLSLLSLAIIIGQAC
jgi:hypothetical protein